MPPFNLPLPPDEPPQGEVLPAPITPQVIRPAAIAVSKPPVKRDLFERMGEMLISLVVGIALGAAGMYIYYEKKMEGLQFAKPIARQAKPKTAFSKKPSESSVVTAPTVKKSSTKKPARAKAKPAKAESKPWLAN